MDSLYNSCYVFRIDTWALSWDVWNGLARLVNTYFLMKLRKYHPTLKTIMQKLNEYFLILILVICIYCKYPVLSPKPLESSAPELFSLCSLRSARRSTLVWSQTASGRLSFYCTSKNLHMMLMKLQTQSHTVH